MKDFVTYEQALALKELGFDEPCIFFWINKNDWAVGRQAGYYNNGFEWCNQNNFNFAEQKHLTSSIIRPSYSQAFRWFREKHNLRGFIGFRPNVKQFDYHIYDMSLSGLEYIKQRTMEEFNKDPKVGTYEEAESACLDQLIKIVKL